MKSLPIPTRPWQLVSQDICTHEKKDYLITVCHFSDWLGVKNFRIPSQLQSSARQRLTLPALASHTCHTENGPQFTCKEYDYFATQHGFQHTTSSPYHPQRNGRAEATIKVSKSTLKKADDLQNTLLNYWNTPPHGHTYSPAQRMLCRRRRTTLPTPDHLLKTSPLNPEMVARELSLSGPQVNNTTTGPKHTLLCISAPTTSDTEDSTLDMWHDHFA